MVDEIDDYELLALQFDNKETPKFNDNARKMKIDIHNIIFIIQKLIYITEQ